MTNYKFASEIYIPGIKPKIPSITVPDDFPHQDDNVVNEWKRNRDQPAEIQQPAHVSVPMPYYPPSSPAQGNRWSSDHPDITNHRPTGIRRNGRDDELNL